MPVINFSGLASGIDSEALIEAVSDAARRGRVQPYEDKVTDLTDTNEALKELKSKLASLKTILEGFGTLQGGPLAKEAVSNDETIVTAVASNSATEGYYDLTVSQLAKNGSISLGSTVGFTSSAALVGAGTIDIDIGDNAGVPLETVSITTDGTTTISAFISNFNAQTDKATASLVNRGTAQDPDYVVLISALKSGIYEGSISINANTIASFDDNSASVARNALFSLDGIAGVIERQSNTVSDLLTGITFNLENTGNATIVVKIDAATTASRVEEFVEAYNEIAEFVNDNNNIEREESGKDVRNIFGALAKTGLDDNAIQSIRTAMSSSSVSGGIVSIFADMGVTSERDGTLKFDEKIFEEALGKDSGSIETILTSFGDRAATTGGTIDMYIRFNGLFDITLKSNEDQITRHNQSISRAEEFISRQEELYRMRFSRLESVMARMQSQQAHLTSILGSLGPSK